MKKLLLIFLCSLLSLSLVAQEGKHYVIHSSGHVLGLGGDNRAVLVGAKSTDAKQLTFAKQSDGSFTIALNGRYLCLGPNSNWDTYFLDKASTPRAHYKVEPAGDYVKLRNVQTNAYLGTDGTAVGNYTFSDKNGSDPKHLWQLGSKPELTISVDTLSYPVSIDASRQLVEGWGVSLCWWASMCGKWSDAKIDQLLDWAVSPNGLNWNIFRYNIGGGDDPNWTNCSAHHMGSGKGLRAEMEGFQDERGGEYHWDRDAAQRKIMLKIREKRPDAIFEAFSNSCPWWMTVSGCCAGNANAGKDNLNPAYYQDFAHYLVDVCKHYRDEYGIEFKTLDPFNEPYTNYWGQAGGQEGCHFDYSSQIAFLKVLEPILKASGLKTVISAADETSISSAVTGLQEYQKAGVMGRIGQCNAHTYSADNRGRSRYGSLGRAAGKTVWMSETGASGQGLGGNLSMAQRLFDDVRYIAPSAWVDWQYVEEGNDQWCLVKGDFKAATMSRVKNYFVRQQVTRFIKPGYSIVASLCDQSLAAVNPACDSLVMVLLNTGTKVVHNVSLPMASIRANVRAWRTSETESLTAVAQGIKVLSDSLVQVVLPAQSITTLVVPITGATAGDPRRRRYLYDRAAVERYGSRVHHGQGTLYCRCRCHRPGPAVAGEESVGGCLYPGEWQGTDTDNVDLLRHLALQDGKQVEEPAVQDRDHRRHERAHPAQWRLGQARMGPLERETYRRHRGGSLGVWHERGGRPPQLVLRQGCLSFLGPDGYRAAYSLCTAAGWGA